VVADSLQFKRAHSRWVLTLLAVVGQVQLLRDANGVVQFACPNAFGLEPLQVYHEDFRQSVQTALEIARGFALGTLVAIARFGLKLIFE